MIDHPQAWAVVLAGGDGNRLRPLTRLITGEDRPKQFCRLFGDGTLLAQTRSRLATTISPEQMVFSLVKAHERFYSDELAGVKPSRLVVQPANMGTTAAIIRSLLRITTLADDPIVGFFPTDHYYVHEMRFVTMIHLALRVARDRKNTVILLGAQADYPEVEYGWIEPGKGLPSPLPSSLHRVNRFWEKPSAHFAQALRARGCLWNTFVMIGRASAFLNILKSAVPRMLQTLGAECHPSDVGSGLPNGGPADAALAPGDFSRQVLSVSTAQLAVLPMGDVGWSDLGTPERVRIAMTRSGLGSQRQGAAQNEIEDMVKTSFA